MKHANTNLLNFSVDQGASEATSVSTLIVVPCYNEEKRLDPQSFLDFAEEHKSMGFVFVNDGSKDNTLGLLTSLRIRCPEQMHFMTLAENSGKAEAVRAGLGYAARLDVKIVGYWDADLATPLHAITDFKTVFDRYDDVNVIYGARKMLMGHRIKRTATRRAISLICATLARLAIALPVSDTQCGAKMFRNSPQLRDALSVPFKSGWLFDIELLTRLSRMIETPRSAFYEYPLSQWDEIEGSNITGKAVMKAGISILGLIARARIMGEETPKASAETMPAGSLVNEDYIQSAMPVRKAA